MAEFNGRTYVGTWSTQPDYPRLGGMLLDGSLFAILGDVFGGGNPLESIGALASDGAEIWRHDGGQYWTRVYKATRETAGFRKAVTHNNRLYMGALNASQGTRVLYSSDGTTWRDLTGGPMDNPDNISIRTMLSHVGLLYVGTENNVTGGELWAYDDGAKSWTHVKTFLEDASVAELEVWENLIAVGTWDFSDSYNFYIEELNGQWKKATPVIPGGEELNNVGVMKLLTFKGQLYLGTANYRDGFTLLRSPDPHLADSWEVISTNGFGNPDNHYVWAMVEWDDRLMLGTFNSGLRGGASPLLPLDASAELYCSEDGLNWDFVPGDYASDFTFGIRNMIVTRNGDLLLGTASNSVLPDFGSWLYTPIFAEMFGSALAAKAAQSALNAFMGVKTGQDPWIGCEVYRAFKKPTRRWPWATFW
jgi:hypothetical protein